MEPEQPEPEDGDLHAAAVVEGEEIEKIRDLAKQQWQGIAEWWWYDGDSVNTAHHDILVPYSTDLSRTLTEGLTGGVAPSGDAQFGTQDSHMHHTSGSVKWQPSATAPPAKLQVSTPCKRWYIARSPEGEGIFQQVEYCKVRTAQAKHVIF